ncbi:uncharacterized protein PV09_06378 [Verruconis gallopava]|uniref:NmrA-like domain-containing protein n=1 Tax=Verruconis gallopava TaxID=253628 RepID=A0A0D2AST2_9PEZI|nr:uncharacterized protein PV09_06378 [Verruconis gallopava]KIW02224.1 hypothetical protein PV09_06378 [Verruconis gallopava]
MSDTARAADPENELLLITCAGGKQASALIPILRPKWKKLRLAVHSDVSARALREKYPDADVVQADLVNPDDARRIMSGVSAIYHVGPSGTPHETQCGFNMIDAAVAEHGTFKHFVLSSVWPTQLRKLMNHDCKRYVEEYLMESGLNFTILQPSHFFENTPVAFFTQQDNPVYPIPYNPDTKFSFTALRDLADAAAAVLEGREKHFYAAYPIISTLPTRYSEFLEIVGRAIGKSIRVEKKSLEEGVALLASRFNAKDEPRKMDVFERILLYYDKRGLWGNPGVSEWLLARKTTSCEEWAKMQAEACRPR